MSSSLLSSCSRFALSFALALAVTGSSSRSSVPVSCQSTSSSTSASSSPAVDWSSPSILRATPAAITGFLIDVGPLNPHHYSPSEYAGLELVYEGLVEFGGTVNPDGSESADKVKPALATSWTTRTDNKTGNYIVDFRLRDKVKFHDGAPWDAYAAVRNFDNVMAPPLRQLNYHGWYDLPLRLVSYEAVDAMTFRLTLDHTYYPAVQELTYIRPIRFVSPNALPIGTVGNLNSCRLSWGNVTSADGQTFVRCDGIGFPAGTGPWKFHSKLTNQRTILPDIVSRPAGDVNTAAQERVLEIRFIANTNYWDGTPAMSGVRFITFTSSADVKRALRNGQLDIAYGTHTLTPDDFNDLRANDTAKLAFLTGKPVNTRSLVANTAKGVTASPLVRSAILALVHRDRIIREALSGLEPAATQLFARSLPYCDVETLPKVMYDPDKAALLLVADGWSRQPGQSAGPLYKNGVPLKVAILCNAHSVNIAIAAVIADDLRSAGFDVAIDGVEKDEYYRRAQAGNFTLAFSETLGAPYDPHGTAASYRRPSDADFAAQQNMTCLPGAAYASVCMNKTQLDAHITLTLASVGEQQTSDRWAILLRALAASVMYAPVSNLVNTAVVSRSFTGFIMGFQQFDFDVTKVRRVSADTSAGNMENNSSSSHNTVAIGVGVALGVVVLAAVAFVVFLVRRERSGQPLFKPLPDYTPSDHHHSEMATKA